MGVTEQERPPALDQIEIAVAVDVGDLRSGCAGDEEGLGTDRIEGTDRRAHPTGDEAPSIVQKLVGTIPQRALRGQVSHSAAFFA
jgi:hypothetical protein